MQIAKQEIQTQIGKASPRLLAPLIGGGYDEGVAGAGILHPFRPAQATEVVCVFGIPPSLW